MTKWIGNRQVPIITKTQGCRIIRAVPIRDIPKVIIIGNDKPLALLALISARRQTHLLWKKSGRRITRTIITSRSKNQKNGTHIQAQAAAPAAATRESRTSHHHIAPPQHERTVIELLRDKDCNGLTPDTKSSNSRRTLTGQFDRIFTDGASGE